MKPLAERLKPVIFEEVIGQERAVRWFQGRVSSGNGGSVIIHGPSGVGKTTLARIYGRAQLCEHPAASGSPCRSCPSCVIFERGQSHPDYFELSLGRIEQVEDTLDALRVRPKLGRRRVVILDEAHQLSPRAGDALLRQLGEPYPWVVIILVTTKIERLPRTIVSRCATLELQLIDFETRLRHLKAICDRESIAAELEALALIAERSGGNVRDLHRILDQAAEDDAAITLEGVKRQLNLDYVDILVLYMRAVLNGDDLQAQIRVIDEWSNSPDKKHREIYEFMHSLFQRELHIRRSNLVMDMIAPEVSEWILEQIRMRSSAAGIPVRQFWQEVVDLWKPEERTTETDLTEKIIKFDSLLSVTKRSELSENSETTSPKSSPNDRLAQRRFRHRRPRQRPSEIAHSHRILSEERPYLSRDQVRQLWDAASFLVQEYGLLLNTHIIVAHELLGVLDPKLGVKLVYDLRHELGMAVKRWDDKSRGFHWLYVHECGERSGFSTTVVAYLAEDLAEAAYEWLFEDFLPGWGDRSLPKDAVRMRTTQYESVQWRARRHQNLMRILCRSVDPDIPVRDNGESRALIDVLRVPKQLREPFRAVQVAQRWRISESIGAGAQAKTRADRLAPLSAFADGAFDHLRTGWEIKEHQDRQRERKERAKALAKIDLKYPDGVNELQDRARSVELEKLGASWPKDPRQRDRAWSGWW